jgi:hypothetical protein
MVKHTSTDAEEDPSIDRQAESESKSNIHESLRIRSLTKTAVGGSTSHTQVGSVGDGGGAEGEEEEQEGPDEFADHGDEVIPKLIRQEPEAGDPHLLLGLAIAPGVGVQGAAAMGAWQPEAGGIADVHDYGRLCFGTCLLGWMRPGWSV